ncbi:hypothetical protein Pint_15388 [Pistacia integerrima]|uniref:Uncharacterized protein n=1 Tax=Pistacia integerrima TaxID=434235 RepID=A0ACC0ZDK2_9ROSI|nr:hypothetical protein Pint_15388 [Pistacia integerrima]
MGNCQAIDTATLVIQHPCGKVDKLYWPVNASEIMRMNPGHYVALLISTTLCPTNTKNIDGCPDNNNPPPPPPPSSPPPPTTTATMGILFDVMKGLWAKKHAKMNRNKPELAEKPERVHEKPKSKDHQGKKHERNRPRTTSSTNTAAAKSRIWQPSLQSISEAGS